MEGENDAKHTLVHKFMTLGVETF